MSYAHVMRTSLFVPLYFIENIRTSMYSCSVMEAIFSRHCLWYKQYTYPWMKVHKILSSHNTLPFDHSHPNNIILRWSTCEWKNRKRKKRIFERICVSNRKNSDLSFAFIERYCYLWCATVRSVDVCGNVYNRGLFDKSLLKRVSLHGYFANADLNEKCRLFWEVVRRNCINAFS